MDFFTRIAEHTPQLNKNDNEILSYCIRNHAEIANLKVTELADRLFSGYPENHSDGTRRNCGTHRGADPPQPPY